MPVSTASSSHVPVSTASSSRVPVSTASSSHVPVSTASNSHVPVNTASSSHVPVSTASSSHVPVSTASNSRVPVSTASNSRVPVSTASNNSLVLSGTSSNNRENDADRTSRNSRSATAIVTGSSSGARVGLTRHNAVIEPNEYGRRAADSTDSRENPYSDARSAGLLYLENNTTVYPESGNKGWSESHKKTKPRF